MSGWWLKNHLEKYEIQWEGLSHIFWTIKHVWNHQPNFLSTSTWLVRDKVAALKSHCRTVSQQQTTSCTLQHKVKNNILKYVSFRHALTWIRPAGITSHHPKSSNRGPMVKPMRGVFYFWVYFITTSHPPNRVIVLVWSCQRLSFWDCYILGCASRLETDYKPSIKLGISHQWAVYTVLWFLATSEMRCARK